MFQHVCMAEVQFFDLCCTLFGITADVDIYPEENDQFKQRTPVSDANDVRSGEEEAE